MKLCKVCNIEKCLMQFNKHAGMKDGHLNKCKSCIKSYKAEYYKQNINTTIAAARVKNKDKYRAAKRSERYKRVRNISRKNRYKNDILYRLSCILRARLKAAIVGYKGIKTLTTIGCSLEHLKLHLESQFTEGMSWDNYGPKGWHIDHIKPLVSFDLTDITQLQLANHYTNLQPLWAEDNLKKGSKYGFSKKFSSEYFSTE